MSDVGEALGVAGVIAILLGVFGFKFPAINLRGGFGNTDTALPQPEPNNGGGEREAPAIDVYNLPKNRDLSFDQVDALAHHIVERYNFDWSAKIAVAMAYQESTFRPWVIRNESGGRQSIGLMQTLIGTAQDMYNKGYTKVGVPNAQTLKDPYVSMYFGIAYCDWLGGNWGGRSWEWYIRAYNGGAGWESSEKGREWTAIHYEKVLSHWQRFYGAGGIAIS